jgi:hypothetical protein
MCPLKNLPLKGVLVGEVVGDDAAVPLALISHPAKGRRATVHYRGSAVDQGGDAGNQGVHRGVGCVLLGDVDAQPPGKVDDRGIGCRVGHAARQEQ